MKILYDIEEACRNQVQGKQIMIQDIPLRRVAEIEHYIRLLGLYDYIEVDRDPIRQTLTIRYYLDEVNKITSNKIELY